MIIGNWNGTWDKGPYIIKDKYRFGFKTVLAIWGENIVLWTVGIPFLFYIWFLLGMAWLENLLIKKK